MTAERWRQISAIYNVAIARGGADRTAYVCSACGGDDDLRREVELLLAQGESFLASPVNLPPGSRIGTYELLEIIGAGGMGIVYRARDLKLQREVALKVLPEAVALEPDRIARFRREATVLASLNHSNIGAIYGFEDSDDVHALVLELVDGPTLADRIAQGPVPLDEALPIARQIAEALEAAHEQGIIHRDLKPANIKVRPDGLVKVLDFGLAKLAESSGSSTTDASLSPTITSPAMNTGIGVLLGTAAYMSPEQAKGRPADKRSDIWGFGCIVFEMLTGKRAFEGDDVGETLARVLMKEPDWGILPASTPEAVRRLLRRTLEKDRTRRLSDVSDARIEIDEALTTSPQAAPTTNARSPLQVWRRRAALIGGLVTSAILIGGAGGAILYSRRSVQNPIGTYRASLLLPPDVTLSTGATGSDQILSLSPDGQRLAFVARDKAGNLQLWVRALDGLVAQPIAAIDNFAVGAGPFWSPDSNAIGFYTGGQLRKISATGGPSIVLCDAARPTGGASWNTNDVIIFAGAGTLYQIPASGGTPAVVMAPDPQRGETNFQWPFFLPDGQHFIFRGKENRTFVGSLGSNNRKEIGAGGNAQYAQGHLVFMRGSALVAQSFDVSRLELTGEAVPIAESVRGQATGAAFSISQTGSVVYQTAETSLSQLRWFDRSGRQIAAIGDPVDQTQIQLSPDGTRATAAILDPSRNTHDLWIYDLARGLRSRFTFDPADDLFSAWSPDGGQIAFSSAQVPTPSLLAGSTFGIYQKAADGSGTPRELLTTSGDKSVTSWSSDGRYLLFNMVPLVALASSSRVFTDVWLLSLSLNGKTWPLAQSQFDERFGRFSPDGRWVAYMSNESGRFEIYVVPTPDLNLLATEKLPPLPTGKWQVSTNGGEIPLWASNGKEIFYLAPDNKLMAAAVDTSSPSFQVRSVTPLFQAQPRRDAGVSYSFGVSADGQHFLVNTVVPNATSGPLTLLVNWSKLANKSD